MSWWRLRRIDETTEETLKVAHEILRDAKETLAITREVVRLLEPRLAHITITLEDPMALDVGKTFVATVTGKDQFGNDFPLDFTQAQPQWSLSDPSLATITQASQAGSEDVTGVAPGSETLSVSFAGLSASLSFTVAQPAPVLTSLVITANPQV